MPGKPSQFWAEHWPLLLRLVEKHRTPRGNIDWERIRTVPEFAHLTRAALRMKYRESPTVARESSWTPPPPPPSPPPPPARDPIELEQERRARLSEIRHERELLEAVAGEKSLRATLENMVRQVIEPLAPPRLLPPPKARAGVVTETMVQHLSDWHAYEVVKASRTRGFGEYDAAIFGRRARQIVTRHLSIKRRMELGGGWRFPRLVVAANGDFVSGTIHEVERHADSPHIVAAVYGCAGVLAQSIRDLSACYQEVEVFCTAGNHGRLPDARRMQQKDPTRSWDTLIYLFAREMLRDVPHVRFFIPDSYSVAYEVEGWRFLQTHGHDVKSWNSIPHYGINRMVSNLNALEASRGTPVNYFLFGHFHNKTSLEHAAGEWFINGSLIGGTEFGVNALGKADRPCQWMVGVHPEEGVSHRWPLRGEGPADAEGYEVAPWPEAA